MLRSTPQQNEPNAQSSMPASCPSGVVQGSPGAPSPPTGTHLVPLKLLSPSAFQGTHLSPSGQSWANESHSAGGRGEPPSGFIRNRCAWVVSLASPESTAPVPGATPLVVGTFTVGSGSSPAVALAAPAVALAAVVVAIVVVGGFTLGPQATIPAIELAPTMNAGKCAENRRDFITLSHRIIVGCSQAPRTTGGAVSAPRTT